MTDARQLKNLADILETAYGAERQSFQTLLSEETRIREDLGKLNSAMRSARSEDDIDRLLIGADIAWQSYLGRKKSDLNMALARLLARKEQQSHALRRAHGKLQVANTLREEQLRSAKVKKARDELESVINLSLARRPDQ